MALVFGSRLSTLFGRLGSIPGTLVVAVNDVFEIAGLRPAALPLGRVGEFFRHAPEFSFLLGAFLDEGEQEFGATHIALKSAVEQGVGQSFAIVADVARCCLGEPGDGVAPGAFLGF